MDKTVIEGMDVKELKVLATEMELDFKKNAGRKKMVEIVLASMGDPSMADEEVGGLEIPVAEGHSIHISEETLEAIAKNDLHKMAELLRNPETEEQVKASMSLSDEKYEEVKAKILEEDLLENGECVDEETEKLYLGKCVKTGKDLYR